MGDGVVLGCRVWVVEGNKGKGVCWKGIIKEREGLELVLI
jgi:hypothetical protein